MMSERIESLKRSVERDEQKAQKLQENIKARKEKIKEMENEEILSDLNSLSAKGISVKKIVAAIKDRDADTLVRLVDGNESFTEECGTGSASQIMKGDKNHE